jgi:hypothetical protein
VSEVSPPRPSGSRDRQVGQLDHARGRKPFAERGTKRKKISKIYATGPRALQTISNRGGSALWLIAVRERTAHGEAVIFLEMQFNCEVLTI